jgi:hypothetical protein
MEYVPGGTLKERILSDSPTDLDKASEWSSQAARAVGFAHERGVIHFYESLTPTQFEVICAYYRLITSRLLNPALPLTKTRS